MEHKAIKTAPQDNVAIATKILPQGSTVVIIGGGEVVANQEIPLGHKIALAPIPKEAGIIRYGEAICTAKEDIKAGDWVHAHNTIS
ncbi:UxaA family hydrolase, partial [Chloroflexota bacterium]